MLTLTTSDKRVINLGHELGSGGEGKVFEVTTFPDQVAKIYHPPKREPEKERKLRAMIAKPPQDDTRRRSPPHTSIAWPLGLVYEQQRFAGYLMPRISHGSEIFEFYNPKKRAQNHPDFAWQYLHRTAKNFATALNALHVRGYVMGDVNQRNVLVMPDTLVTLIDTDSFQVRDKNGYVYRCLVGIDEFIPPELSSKKPLGSVDREPYHDCFGLAIIIFQLLMEGVHPFTGVPKNPAQPVPETTYRYCIEHGIFPYQANNQFNPPPSAPDFAALHPELQRLFRRCFVDGYKHPTQRPTAHDWIDVLTTAENSLVQCKYDTTHWYSKHVVECPWCKRSRKMTGSKQNIPIQQSLPSVASKSKASATIDCPKCGLKNSPNEIYCQNPNCGYQLSGDKVCSNCNQHSPVNAIFCPHCGHHF